ncbi:DUF3899 domain-containing protein [Levilactobacillus yonginensis]|uniref:DUF3899 domain-containing protein n=1 Tax=Levilactobacillus yonginensis TaxID=1054041 RepID=UPI00345D6F6F
MKNWKRATTGTVAAGLLIALIMKVLGQSFMLIGNLLFMLGLAFLVFGALCVLAKGHLFTGWRHRRKKGQDPLPGEKIGVRHVASVKNSPIVVNPLARFGLVTGICYIILGIVFTI